MMRVDPATTDLATRQGNAMQDNGSVALPSRRVVLGSGAAATAALALPLGATAAPTSSGARPQAWSAQVGAAWTRVPGSGGRHYAVPRLVTLHAAGPGPVPAGTAVRVTVDAALVPRLAAGAGVRDDDVAVQGSVRLAHVPGVVRLEWVLAHPLPAGSTVSVPLAHEGRAPAGRGSALHHPVVEVVGAPAALAAQVATGRESVTRRDHVADAAAGA